MNDHALAKTKPSKNNACFFYYHYYLKGAHIQVVLGDRVVIHPPPKHSISLNLDVANLIMTFKRSYSATSTLINFT